MCTARVAPRRFSTFARGFYIFYTEEKRFQIFTQSYFGVLAEVLHKAKCYTGSIAAAQYFLPRRIVYRSRPRLPPIDFTTHVKRRHRRFGRCRPIFQPLSNDATSPRGHKHARSTILQYFFQLFREREIGRRLDISGVFYKIPKIDFSVWF